MQHITHIVCPFVFQLRHPVGSSQGKVKTEVRKNSCEQYCPFNKLKTHMPQIKFRARDKILIIVICFISSLLITTVV